MPQTTAQATVKTAVAKLVGAIQSDPAAASVTLTVRTALKHGMLCEAKTRRHGPLAVDEVTNFGGADTAMNPVELVLAALGTCQEISYVTFAAVAGIPLEGVRVRVRGYMDLHGLLGLDENVPAGCQRIDYLTEIDSPADEAAIRQLVHSVESRCAVLNMLRAVKISGSVSLNGRELKTAG